MFISGLTNWSVWNACSATVCGKGTQKSHRSCPEGNCDPSEGLERTQDCNARYNCKSIQKLYIQQNEYNMCIRFVGLEFLEFLQRNVRERNSEKRTCMPKRQL